MTTKSKPVDTSTKGKGNESIWKRALIANAEWPDKVSFRITRLLNVEWNDCIHVLIMNIYCFRMNF